MNTRRFSIAGALALGVVLLVAVNMAGQALLKGVRLDLTEGRIYTLSEGTREILAGLEEPVTVRLFLSRKLATRIPSVGAWATRIEEMLREYQRLAPERLTLHVIDPEPFSEEEDRAVGYGLQGVALQDNESVLYLGLVATGPTGQEAVIPFFSPEREEQLEYDLTKAIYQVGQAKRPVVGLVSGLEMGQEDVMRPGGPGEAWVILDQMRQLFELRELKKNPQVIAPGIDVLVVIDPTEFQPETIYAIDQFALRGGRVVLFLDPYADSLGQIKAVRRVTGPLADLLTAWGIKADDKVTGDLRLAERVQSNRDRSLVLDYPLWMGLGPDQMDANDMVTAKVGNLFFATPGAWELTEGSTSELTPLVWTTESSIAVDASEVAITPDAMEIVRSHRPLGVRRTLATRLHAAGLKTAFPDGPPPRSAGQETPEELAEDERPLPHIATAEKPLQAILIADTDLLQDDFWVRTQRIGGNTVAVPTSGNGNFVTNVIDHLAGSDALISVRNRGGFSRPFERIQALREAAEITFRQREQDLVAALREVENNLLEMQRGKGDTGSDALTLSEEQRQEIARFQEQRLATRAELRQVRHELNKDIERLESTLRFANIGLVPLLVAIGGVIAAWRRGARRAEARRSVGALN